MMIACPPLAASRRRKTPSVLTFATIGSAAPGGRTLALAASGWPYGIHFVAGEFLAEVHAGTEALLSEALQMGWSCVSHEPGHAGAHAVSVPVGRLAMTDLDTDYGQGFTYRWNADLVVYGAIDTPERLNQAAEYALTGYRVVAGVQGTSAQDARDQVLALARRGPRLYVFEPDFHDVVPRLSFLSGTDARGDVLVAEEVLSPHLQAHVAKQTVP